MALEMLRAGDLRLYRDEVSEIVHELLPSLRLHSDSLESVLHWLFARTGLFREVRKDVYEFVHKSFFEYLAAHRAYESRHKREILENASQRRYQYVLLMLAGLVDRSIASSIVQKFLDLAKQKKSERKLYVLLALYAAESARELDPIVDSEVKQAASKLLPPRSQADVEGLALAGDLIVPLAAQGSFSGKELSMIVQLLATIGSWQAVELIGQLAPRVSLAEQVYLYECWFDLAQVGIAEKALAKCDKVDVVILDNDSHGDLRFSACEHVIAWHIKEVCFASTLHDLAKCRGLKWLEIDVLELGSEDELPEFSGLTGLVIREVRSVTASLSGLTLCPSLEWLALPKSIVPERSELFGLKRLKWLGSFGEEVGGFERTDELECLERIFEGPTERGYERSINLSVFPALSLLFEDDEASAGNLNVLCAVDLDFWLSDAHGQLLLFQRYFERSGVSESILKNLKYSIHCFETHRFLAQLANPLVGRLSSEWLERAVTLMEFMIELSVLAGQASGPSVEKLLLLTQEENDAYLELRGHLQLSGAQ